MSEGAVVFRPSDQPARRLDTSRLQFEIYEPGPRDVLRVVLTSCVESCIVTWQFVRSLGFGSTPTILDKLPYHKAAFRRPKVRYSRDLEWLRSVAGQAPASSGGEHTSPPSPAAASALAPVAIATPPRPRYWRDAFGPGVVIPLNIFLGWLLINADLINIRL